MKKTYVKPTAECEEFVANEFVAACWNVRCELDNIPVVPCKYEAWNIGGDYETFDEAYKAYKSTKAYDYKYIHENNATCNGVTSSKYHHIGGSLVKVCHGLTYSDVATKEHPNASV